MKTRRGECVSAPFVPLVLDPKYVPKKHTIGPGDGQLHVGATVFYRGERYYVSICPEDWEFTHTVHICSKPIRPGGVQPTDGEEFCVHADLLDTVLKAPKNPYASRQPTAKSVERAERAKSGQRDVGDPVAELLRPLTLDQMFDAAASYLQEDPDTLRDKYAHLDNGRKRMVLGNRMRAKYNKEGA